VLGVERRRSRAPGARVLSSCCERPPASTISAMRSSCLTDLLEERGAARVLLGGEVSRLGVGLIEQGLSFMPGGLAALGELLDQIAQGLLLGLMEGPTGARRIGLYGRAVDPRLSDKRSVWLRGLG
jgi:hypothetical protein